MAIYQPPPVPPVMVGGAQPYAPKINPAIKPGWSVDNPPSGGTEIIPYVGPYKLPLLPPLEAAITPPPPATPFVGNVNADWLAGILTSWQPPDPQPQPEVPPKSIPQAPSWQPYAPKWMSGVLTTWQPDQWPYVFLGGPQPRKLSPGIPGQSINPPPPFAGILGDYIQIITAAWTPPDPQPTLPKNLNPSITSVQTDNPPGFTNVLIYTPDDPFPIQLPRYVPQVAVTAAFTPSANKWLSGVLSSWLPPDPQPTQANKLNPQITAVRVDNPPGFLNDFVSVVDDPFPVQLPRYYPQASAVVVTYIPQVTKWMSGVLTSWQSPDPQPTLPRNLNPSITTVRVDNPPGFTNVLIYTPDDLVAPILPRYVVQPFVASFYVPKVTTWLPNILVSWQLPDPQPTLPKNLNPQITAVRVDNPPGFVNEYIPDPVAPWMPILPRYFTQPFTVSYTPRPTPWMPSVVASWQLPDPQPTLPRNLNPQITAVEVDNPPGIGFPNIIWIDDVPMPTMPRYVVQPFVASFYVPKVTTWLPNILVSWQLPDPLPTLPRNLNPQLTAVTVNNPPFQHMGRHAITNDVVRSWQPPDPWPTQRPVLAAFGIPATVNNPPFSHYGRIEITVELINRMWVPPDPQPTLPTIKVIPQAPAWQPFAPAWLSGVLTSWIPPAPPPTLPTQFVQFVAVTYVPYTRPWLATVSTSWQLPDPFPTLPRNLSPGIPGQSVDNPPSLRTLPPYPIADVPYPTQRTFSVPVAARTIPIETAWFATVVSLWQPVPPPIEPQHKLPPQLTAVRVDNPPFDMRARITPDVVRSWQPELLYYSVLYGRARLIPFTQATIVKHPLLAGTYTVATLIGIDGQPVLGGTSSTPNLQGDP